MNNVVGQAVDEFSKQIGSSTGAGSVMGATATSLSTTASKKQDSSAFKTDSSEQVLDIMNRAEMFGQKKMPFKPNLQPIIGKGAGVPRIGNPKAKVEPTVAAKPVNNSSGGIVVG